MLNAQHYYEELSIVLSNTKKPLTCAIRAVKDKVDYIKEPECHISYRYCDKCKKDMKEWFFSEYEPEELGNGDGLAPGQIIEVSNVEGYWIKQPFIAYYNVLFWCQHEEKKALAWKRARLPKKVDDEE